MHEAGKSKFGKGQISGYVSASLGMLSLCGVICFLFPSLFTSEQFRNAYTADFARGTLFVALIAAYFTGIVSYVLNHTKTLAWIGIGTSLTASLLGGSRIEVQPFESTSYSFGLDWFALSFFFSVLILVPIEKAFALNRNQGVLRAGWRTDLVYFFVSHMAIQFIFLFVNAFSETLFGWAVNGHLQGSVRSLPIWCQFIVATILADLFQYAAHRLHHLVPFLWRFHSIHHSSHTMDWLAGSRTHLVEIMITRAIVMVPLYLCGFSEGALNAYVILVGIQAVAIHANVGINFGPLRYLLATPQFHHWHHSKDREYMDANYAVAPAGHRYDFRNLQMPQRPVARRVWGGQWRTSANVLASITSSFPAQVGLNVGRRAEIGQRAECHGHALRRVELRHNQSWPMPTTGRGRAAWRPFLWTK